jgi:hypothetical protein
VKTTLYVKVAENWLYVSFRTEPRVAEHLFRETNRRFKEWIKHYGYRIIWDDEYKHYRIRKGFLKHIYDEKWWRIIGIDDIRLHNPEDKMKDT